MALNGKQRRQLRAMGHHLNPVVIVGQEGVTPGVVAAVEQALYDHELIKVKINEGPEDRKTAAKRLAVDAEAELAQVLGRTALLYKARPDDPKIVLVKGGGIAAEGEELEDEEAAEALDVEDTLRYGEPLQGEAAETGFEDTDVHAAHVEEEEAPAAEERAMGAEGEGEEEELEEVAARVEPETEAQPAGEVNEELEREEELAEDTGEELAPKRPAAAKRRAAPKKKAAAGAKKAKPAAKKKPAAAKKAKPAKSARATAAKKKPAAAKKTVAKKKAPAKKKPAASAKKKSGRK